MISLASITFITVASILLCFGLVCASVIFCCCAFSSVHLCGTLICCAGSSLLFGRKYQQSNLPGGGYQSSSNSGVHFMNSSCSSPSASIVNENEIMLADAVIVAPFAEARVISDNTISPSRSHFSSERMSPIDRVGTIESGQYPKMVFKDVWAAIVFVSQAIVIIWFAVEVSLQSMNVTKSTYYDENGLVAVAIACLILGAAATLMGTICLTFVLRNADYIIEGVMWVNIALCALGSILCLASGGAYLFALLLGATAAFNYWYLNSVRPRIAFASAVLSVACQAVKDNYFGTILSAYFLLVVQLSWFSVWSIAAYGVGLSSLVNNDTNDNELSGGQLVMAFFLLLSLFWGSEVIKTILQTTVNGVIACWWFQPSRKAIVRGALFRSVTTSFGSVCLGSFAVSFIHTVRETIKIILNKSEHNNSRRERGGDGYVLVAKVLECLLGLVERAMAYFNKYAYCYVAGYGMGFIEAAQKVTRLFIEKGWTSIVNDNLVGNAFTFAMFGMAALSALFGFFSTLFLGPLLNSVGIAQPYILLSIIGALMGFAVAVVLTNALSSGVAMVFVCMAESPNALRDNHPKEFLQLTTAWDSFHPNNSWVSPLTVWPNPQGPPGGNNPQGQRGQIPAAIPFRPNEAVYQRIQQHNDHPYKTQVHSSSAGSLLPNNYDPNQMTYEEMRNSVQNNREYYDRMPTTSYGRSGERSMQDTAYNPIQTGYEGSQNTQYYERTPQGHQGQVVERQDYQDLHGHQVLGGGNQHQQQQQQEQYGYQNQQGQIYGNRNESYYPPAVTQSQYPQQQISRQQAPQYPQQQQREHQEYPASTLGNQYYQRQPQEAFETTRNQQEYQSAHGHTIPATATAMGYPPDQGPLRGSGSTPSAPPMSEY